MSVFRWSAAALLILGLGLVGYSVWSMASYLDLQEIGEDAAVIHAYYDAGRERDVGVYEVAGQRYDLAGDFGLGDVIVYDPENPARARAEWDVGGFSSGERLLLSLGGAGVVFGIVVWLLERFGTAREEEELHALLKDR
jgi:hypothetical protein